MAASSLVRSTLAASLFFSATAVAQTAPPAPVAAPAPVVAPAPVAAPAPAPVVIEAQSATIVVSAPGAAPQPAVAPQAPLAPPPPAPLAPPPPAPQNASWSQVSHVNGQLVPVGQKNDYFYRYRRTNISINPIGWMIGFYGLSVSYGLNDHLAIRGDINYMSPPDSDETGVELGVGLPIYFRRTYQGAFLEPGFIARAVSSNYDCGGCDGDSVVGPQVLAGWHWTWDSGLNIAAAFGLGRNFADDDEYYDEYGYEYDDEEEVFANGYLRFGYAF